mmetsp:Transcript_14857/g.24625  ORF Transcript_14857/g.24625 Transcript_14857/m.24625 type:complete len:250 (-) Transcript_14857:1160-1909(-)|eukprot:CAMPEP_0184348920 /NCGR_PEP_ID=MMETSP1089-20130417/32044_1 /TAXON_ID=38269 ORGANISM="Gloeochaete wittrockiana, Strain SAG46.84" /NCGR_SAMPLE_ID=MMETSP1089 /ASSEMBLY_ACC=CAM_ASM_000445 /LENGTH=249 /DNA_ID=CAMNT_0026680921 /DNA_START=249 /DNA_END=998 /DNA_ORIENTATION=-
MSSQTSLSDQARATLARRHPEESPVFVNPSASINIEAPHQPPVIHAHGTLLATSERIFFVPTNYNPDRETEFIDIPLGCVDREKLAQPLIGKSHVDFSMGDFLGNSKVRLFLGSAALEFMAVFMALLYRTRFQTAFDLPCDVPSLDSGPLGLPPRVTTPMLRQRLAEKEKCTSNALEQNVALVLPDDPEHILLVDAFSHEEIEHEHEEEKALRARQVKQFFRTVQDLNSFKMALAMQDYMAIRVGCHNH